eukprot:CAMPEP_0173397076 /NCGR_PEP_ID=MMETSP1356-20130122/37309_1 /TAXON_ID=77927 ORGANISM="Hemiselmis virescens, Strain PCC157" /NCGR_SAMPLE_ID=MMETSP1356 /ASSEMBLY_ACC=CAM_ASM_000847 /LENGTH=107 /DNA_ID=CAMNT_0014356243 /DNA_START=75 /DNA_END=395 /DNA_ORIENTATION=+
MIKRKQRVGGIVWSQAERNLGPSVQIPPAEPSLCWEDFCELSNLPVVLFHQGFDLLGHSRDQRQRVVLTLEGTFRRRAFLQHRHLAEERHGRREHPLRRRVVDPADH